jgi:hypothetical protein
MRAMALGVMAGAAALFVAAPASAREIELSGGLFARGAITIAWHGDPARGCAAAGLCGYSGSLSVRPDDGQYYFTLAGGRLRDSYSSLDVFSIQPVVRVKRTEDGNEAGACVDVPASSTIDLTTARAGRNRVRLGVDEEGLSPGHCAGPDLSNLLTKLPRRTRSLSRIIAGRARGADFSGRVPFSKGRFSGTIHSTLRLGFGKGDPGTVTRTVGRPPRDRRPLVRVVDVRAVYRVASFAGALTTSFGALTDPPCAELDACGVSGSSRWTVNSGRGVVAIDAVARARRTDRGLRGALAAVRRGPASVFGEGDLSRNVGTISADISRAGGADCHDTASAGSPGVVVLNVPAKRLTFELAGEDAFPAVVDLVRTGCPGPREEDALGPDVPAQGSVSLSAFGQSSIAGRMRGSGQFSAKGYSGTSSVDVTLTLRRVSIHAAYRRARGIE